MNIPFSTFKYMNKEIKNDIQEEFNTTFEEGWYIQGEKCKEFENAWAEYCEAKYCVGVGNGMDAIYLALRALGIGKGDEVIIPSHTFIATALAVEYAGATTVFCEVEEEYYTINANLIEKSITNKTKAIIVVQLYGQTAEMDAVNKIAKKYDLFVIEDAAQAHGATYRGKKVGSLADVAAFSFYPGKNLGALGDGGAAVTDKQEIENKIRALGCYGSIQKYIHEYTGINSRLDELQASFLSVKLKKLDKWTIERSKIAEKYLKSINNKKLVLPSIRENGTHVWHLFVIRCETRNLLQTYLEEKGISTVIHYPIPIHLQKAFSHYDYKKGDFPIAEKMAETVLSLPLYVGMKEEEVDYVIKTLNEY